MKNKLIKNEGRVEKAYFYFSIAFFTLILLLFVAFVIPYVTSDSSGTGSSSAEIVDLTSPNIDLISPSADYSTTSTTIDFLYNVSDSSNVSNCSLIISDAVDQTNETINKSQTQKFTKTFSLGSYPLYISCMDTRGNKGSSTAIVITVTSSSSPPGGGGGGGGGAVATKEISINIIIPSTISLTKTGKTEFSITLENDGDVDFKDVSISGYLLGNSEPMNASVTFDTGFIKLFEQGKTETLLVTTFIEDPEILFYEVVINVTSKTPVYNNYNKVFIHFLAKDQTSVVKIIAFTESIINENVECVELMDMLEDAKVELAAGNLEEANNKAQAAMEACKRTIEGIEKPQAVSQKENKLPFYLAIAAGSAVALGLLFNLYRQIRLRGWKKFSNKNK